MHKTAPIPENIEHVLNHLQMRKLGTAAGELLIYNSPINNYPQVVEIYRNDTGELIYTSSGIPVGSRIDTDTLDVDLPAGDYDCTAYFNAVDPETSQMVGRAGANITIKVLG